MIASGPTGAFILSSRGNFLPTPAKPRTLNNLKQGKGPKGPDEARYRQCPEFPLWIVKRLHSAPPSSEQSIAHLRA
jgi:hypothetical protein